MFERVILIEMPGNAEQSLGNNQQTINDPISLGSGTSQAAASSFLPNFHKFEMMHSKSNAKLVESHC